MGPSSVSRTTHSDLPLIGRLQNLRRNKTSLRLTVYTHLASCADLQPVLQSHGSRYFCWVYPLVMLEAPVEAFGWVSLGNGKVSTMSAVRYQGEVTSRHMVQYAPDLAVICMPTWVWAKLRAKDKSFPPCQA